MKINKAIIGVGMVVVVAVLGVFYWSNQQSLAKFKPTRPESTQTYTFRVSESAELDGVVGNLEYYGFINDKQTLIKALKQSQDTTPGDENSIKVGNNTIDRQAEYKLSQSMDTWQIANILLNEGTHQDCSHGCPPGLFYPELLPGGDPAPSLREKYEWVKSFVDCVEAKGQLSSEQYTERTGEPRHCVSPDGREFIQGQEGWREFVGG